MYVCMYSYFAAKDFTPHKPRFRATFFARPRVTGNTKLTKLRNYEINSNSDRIYAVTPNKQT